MKKLLSLLLVAMMSMSLVACSGTETSESTEGNDPQSTQTQEVETSEEPEVSAEPISITLSDTGTFAGGFHTVLNEGNSSGGYGAMPYLSNFYETLVVYDAGEYKPGLAESWDITNDGKTYTFYLKEGVIFSDGEAFNAESAKISIEAAPINLGMYNGTCGLTTANIESVNVIDEYTLELNLLEPYYGTLHDMSMVDPLGMMSPNAYNDDLTVSEDVKVTSFGSGPYMYDGDVDGSNYTFVRNPNYSGEAPEVDQFTITLIADTDATMLAIRNGEIDLVTGSDRISLDAFHEFNSTDGFTAQTSDSYEKSAFLGFNTDVFPFNDQVVRNAVAIAIDKDVMCESVFNGYYDPASSIYPDDYPYCSSLPQSRGLDVEAAKNLLEENGYVDTDGDGVREKDGQALSVELKYAISTSSVDDAMLLVASDMEEIGFEVQVTGIDFMTWMGEITSGNFSISAQNTYGIQYDPYTATGNMHSTMVYDPLFSQVGKNNAEIDSIIDEMSVSTDIDFIEESYNQIFSFVTESDIIIPLYQQPYISIFNSEKIASYDANDTGMQIIVANIDVK